MSGCAELVSGVSQLAHNTALGMAAMCGNGIVPLADAPGLVFAPHPAQLAAMPTLQPGDRPVIVAHGVYKPLRQFAPHSAAEYTTIDPASGKRAFPAAMPFRLGALSASTQPERPGQRAEQAVLEWEVRQAQPDEQARLPTEALAGNGGRVSGGYVFFDEAGNAAQTEAGATAAASGYMHADVNETTATGEATQATAISGDVATDVSGDNIDPLAKDYSLTPDALLSRGGITLSGGYSSVEGVSIGGKIARQNIGGANREIAASARYSKVRQLLEIGYADANFLGGSLGFAPTLFAHRTSAKGFGNGLRSTPFAQSSYGIGIQFTRKFENRLSVTANYRLSSDAFRMRGKNKICDASFFGSPLCNALGSSTNSLLSVSLAFDRRNREGGTTRGFRLRVAQDVGLGGSAPFTKTRLGGEAHIGLGENWTLLVDAEGGYLASIGGKAIPLFDRFYAGDTSLRGFDLRGVGPKVRPTGAVHSQNVAIGGRAYYAARAELSGSIGGVFDKYGVQPSLFVDAGSVFGASRARLMPGETLLGNSAKPRVAAGLGLAMKTPAGTLRLDFARSLVKQPGDRTQSFSISFGAAI